MSAPANHTRDEIKRQNRGLLHALQTAHPVLLDGVKYFIQTILYHEGSGCTEAVVYLRGRSEPVPPHELTPDPHHNARGSITSDNES